jgi:hypothetical protein
MFGATAYQDWSVLLLGQGWPQWTLTVKVVHSQNQLIRRVFTLGEERIRQQTSSMSVCSKLSTDHNDCNLWKASPNDGEKLEP